MSRRNPVRARDGPKPVLHLGMHVDASRDALSGYLPFYSLFVVRAMCVFGFWFLVFPPYGQRGGGGTAGVPLFVIFFLVQQTTSGIGYRVKWLFRTGKQYAWCEKQQESTTFSSTKQLRGFHLSAHTEYWITFSAQQCLGVLAFRAISTESAIVSQHTHCFLKSSLQTLVRLKTK